VSGRRPRLLIVGRTRITFPLSTTLERRFEALSDVLAWRQLGSGRGGDSRFALARPFPVRRLDGMIFYVLLPLRVARELRRFRPDAVLVQGAQETALVLLARLLARVHAPVILDVHGDWRVPTRLYGSPLRKLLAPLADLLAGIAVRRADAIRTVSGFTTRLVREAGRAPAAVFPAYMDLTPFTERPPEPLPPQPAAVFVGVLERYKGLDVLEAAWPRVRERVPGAALRIVGKGALRPPSGPDISWTPELSTEEVAVALDEATVLVLPSRTEGMGRVVVEAFCRGRAVVGSNDGGIPDLVEDGVSGLLVPAGDAEALATALGLVLGDPVLAERLGAGASRAAERWVATPEAWAARLRELVDRTVEAAP
jgi:glycosyltransferase involved in cell wall biosynthesis